MAEYIPAPNDGEQNYHKENDAKNFLALSVGLALIAGVVFVLLTQFVAIATHFIPEDKEYEIFRADEILDEQNADDTKLKAQISAMLLRLNSCAHIKNEYFLAIDDSKIPNASTALDGSLTVNRGLFAHIKSENGLAFVLAHELAHFKHRDHLKGISNSALIGILLGFGDEKIASMLGTALTSKYSRSQEVAADAQALDTLACVYGHTGGAEEFFESISKLDDSDAISNLFESHPLLQKRIADIKSFRFVREKPVPLERNLSEISKVKEKMKF